MSGHRRGTVRSSWVWLIVPAFVLSILPWTPGAQASGSRELSGAQLAASKECPWAACAQVITAVAGGTKLEKLPANLSPSLQDASSDISPPPGLEGCVVGQAALSTPFSCVYNAAATTKRMVLVGDSHAEMWSPAIAAIAQANGYSLLFLSKIPCPLPMVTFFDALNDTPNPQCTTWKKWAFGRINQFDPSIVIGTTEDDNPYGANGLPMSQKEYSGGLVTALRDLSAPGRRVFLLGDMPYLTQTGPICLAAHEGDVQSCSTPTAQAAFPANQAAQRSAASKAGADFIDTIPWLCTPRSCPAVVANLDVYENDAHITATYGIWLEKVLSEALGLGAS